MNRKKVRKRATKADWLAVALQKLEAGGVSSVRVEGLARQLGIAKAGFYWHFRDRADLLKQLLDYWSHEYTQVATANPELYRGDPKLRLRKLMEMILEHDLGKYDLAMRGWASRDRKVAKRVAEVYDLRLGLLRDIFKELGFTGAELDMRARLFVCYHSWERTMFWHESKQKLRSLIKRRVDLLTRK